MTEVEQLQQKIKELESHIADVWGSYDAYKDAMREVFWQQQKALNSVKDENERLKQKLTLQKHDDGV